jgi:hypothetical protein
MFWKFGFGIIAAWVVGGIIFTITAMSRYVFEPDALYRNGLTRREMFGHRLAAAWLWPFYLFSMSGRQLLFFMLEDNQGIQDENGL